MKLSSFLLMAALAGAQEMKSTFLGGPKFNMTYLNTDRIQFTVNDVSKNSYFGIAFDSDLINTDMVTFHGDGKVRDLWSNRLARAFDDKTYNI